MPGPAVANHGSATPPVRAGSPMPFSMGQPGRATFWPT